MSSSWSRDAVIYEIYVRSFADSDGDGDGDLLGVASRLAYLEDLGVDAIWLTPFYRSPMTDGGYDVSDHRDVDPRFGTLDDFDTLLAAAHRRGLKVIIDVVPNHTSAAHRWFTEALAAGPGSPARQRFHFRSGGEAPPNNWTSVFHGPAWTRLADGDWYLHLFAPEQPDLNWDHPDVRDEFDGVLRFWLDRGVDGIRIDVAHGLVKAPSLPDTVGTAALLDGAPAPYFDQDGVHEIYRGWRSILDTYAPERIAVAEAWLPSQERTARYVRPGELHQAFNFELLGADWSGPGYRRVIDGSLRAMSSVGAPTSWVMSNHDVVRHASRLSSGRGGTAGGASAAVAVTDGLAEGLGQRRARAAALMLLALPGSVYLYQGEELGLPEVFDLPAEARRDPIFARTNGAELGRDGCRVPLPWSGTEAPYGFGPAGSTPWLPQPASWAGLSVSAQDDPSSTLSLYREALRLRRRFGALGDGPLEWLSAPDSEVLAFRRPGPSTVVCVVNLGSSPVPLESGTVLLASGELAEGALPGDTAVWLAV